MGPFDHGFPGPQKKSKKKKNNFKKEIKLVFLFCFSCGIWIFQKSLNIQFLFVFKCDAVNLVLSSWSCRVQ